MFVFKGKSRWWSVLWYWLRVWRIIFEVMFLVWWLCVWDWGRGDYGGYVVKIGIVEEFLENYK